MSDANKQFAQELVGGGQTKEASESEEEAFTVGELLKEAGAADAGSEDESADAVNQFMDLLGKEAEGDDEDSDSDKKDSDSKEDDEDESDSGDYEGDKDKESDSGGGDQSQPQQAQPQPNPAPPQPGPAQQQNPGVPPVIQRLLNKQAEKDSGSESEKQAGGDAETADYSDEEALKDAAMVLSTKIASGAPVDELILGDAIEDGGENKEAGDDDREVISDEEAEKVADLFLDELEAA